MIYEKSVSTQWYQYIFENGLVAKALEKPPKLRERASDTGFINHSWKIWQEMMGRDSSRWFQKKRIRIDSHIKMDSLGNHSIKLWVNKRWWRCWMIVRCSTLAVVGCRAVIEQGGFRGLGGITLPLHCKAVNTLARAAFLHVLQRGLECSYYSQLQCNT